MSRDSLNINVFGEETYFNDDVTFFKNVKIGGNLEVDGTFLVKENATFKKDVIIEGKLDLDELLVKTRLDVDGTTDLDVLNVSETASFTSTTDNTLGDTNTGAVQVNGGVGIDKNLTVGQAIQATNLNITGVGTIGLNLNVGGVTTLASNGGITTTGGDLYVGGDIYFADGSNGSGKVLQLKSNESTQEVQSNITQSYYSISNTITLTTVGTNSQFFIIGYAHVYSNSNTYSRHNIGFSVTNGSTTTTISGVDGGGGDSWGSNASTESVGVTLNRSTLWTPNTQINSNVTLTFNLLGARYDPGGTSYWNLSSYSHNNTITVMELLP